MSGTLGSVADGRLKLRVEDFFDFATCERCGTCLAECPVLSYPPPRARAEKEKLLRGKRSEVLDRCKSCFSCERLCSHGCHPYYLILYRWFERYQRQGIPEHALRSLPGDHHNYLSAAEASYTHRERALVAQWAANARADLSGRDVIFAGCNALIFPSLLDSPLWAPLTVIGARGLCCGEVPFRMGLFDRTRALAHDLSAMYELTRPRRVFMFCLAGYHMQKHILPQRFGCDFQPEIVYLLDWLLDRIKSGELTVKAPINRRVVLQDSCHAKALGPGFFDKPRELLRLLGATVVDMDPCREKQICCGMADGIPRFSPIDMVAGGLRQWRLAQASGADVFVPYCATCYLMLRIAHLIYPSRLPCRHLLELVGPALGFRIHSQGRQRTSKVLGAMLAGGMRDLLRGGRVRPTR